MMCRVLESRVGSLGQPACVSDSASSASRRRRASRMRLAKAAASRCVRP